MMRNVFRIIAFFIAVLWMNSNLHAQQVSIDDLCRQANISPEQCAALKASSAGGQPTPGFTSLNPEEIQKGREMLKLKERSDKLQEEALRATEQQQMLQKEAAKRIIGEEQKRENLFDRSRQTGRYQGISRDLKPFGYEFFQEAAVRVTTDRKDIPVPLKYIIGPGDEVKILLWGRVNAQHNLTVDRDGKITIPQIGPIFVAGMTFEDMSKRVITQTEQIVGANIDITLGSLKTIPIFILGDVRRPGAYTIGSFATITDALLMAGGPTDVGSMRNVQLRRKNKTITVLDMYDLFLKGDKSKDMTLLADDIVFVPVTGPIVGIAGNVRRPAIYELKDRFDFQSLFDLSGGILPSAFTQQIQVSRIQRNERQIVIDIDDKQVNKMASFLLQDADLVNIFNIVDKDLNAVFLSGNIKRPGKYEYKEGMKFGDLIKDPADLLDETHFEYALIKRITHPERRIELVPFNIGKFLLEKDESQNIALKPEDHIYVFSKWLFLDKPFAHIEGEIRGQIDIPGKTKVVDETKTTADKQAAPRKRFRLEIEDNMRIKDAILSVGGVTKDAYMERGELIRCVDDCREYHTIYFSLARAIEGDLQNNLLLQNRDRIVIHSIWEHSFVKSVSIEGDVSRPGTYQYTENIRVSDLVFKAGNVLESAFLGEAEISSQILEDGMIVKLDHRKINLRKALNNDPYNNVYLKPYDRLFVKRITNWRDENFISLSGELMFPGRYAIKKGERLSSVIERAGGYTDRAYLRGAVFKRETVRELQQQGLEEMIKRLQRDLLTEGGTVVSTALSTEEIAAKKVEMEQKQKFIANLQQLKAIGRMSISLAHLRLLKGSEFDIELENGDNLYIPPRPSVVNVTGAVMSLGSYLYNEKHELEDYVELSGGYSRFADIKHTYILKIDGSARKAARGFMDWNAGRSRWELDAFGEKMKEIEPGDTIIVPEKIERIAWLREIRDITQILMQMAVTTGVIIKLF